MRRRNAPIDHDATTAGSYSSAPRRRGGRRPGPASSSSAWQGKKGAKHHHQAQPPGRDGRWRWRRRRPGARAASCCCCWRVAALVLGCRSPGARSDLAGRLPSCCWLLLLAAAAGLAPRACRLPTAHQADARRNMNRCCSPLLVVGGRGGGGACVGFLGSDDAQAFAGAACVALVLGAGCPSRCQENATVLPAAACWFSASGSSTKRRRAGGR